MAARGRGGGAGRGQNRGGTFNPRDMGQNPGEQLPTAVLQPPPTYPPLNNQPNTLQVGPEIEYMIALKKDLAVFLKDFMSFTDNKDWEINFDWRRLPAELNCGRGTKRPAGLDRTSNKRVHFDITKLDALAKLEEGEDSEKEKADKDGKEEENEENEDDEVEDVDEEMDDGTDYGQNYFDNGEDYIDDDDNGNDGPIFN